jgi:hypothetical protein
MIVTKIDRFIALNKHRDDIVGDVCKDLAADKNFPLNHEEQMDFLEDMGNMYPWMREPITKFLEAVVAM